MAASGTSMPGHVVRQDPQAARRMDRLILFLKTFARVAFSPYRPEQHYMRGPGPACRARQRGERIR